MNYDDIFGDNIYEENASNIEQDFNDLAEIFNNNGFDKQLQTLTLAGCDLLGLSTIYKDNKDKDINYKRLIQSMAIVHTLIETFITSDDGIYDMFEEVRDKYIEKELGKSDNIPINIKKRMAYLQQYKKL